MSADGPASTDPAAEATAAEDGRAYGLRPGAPDPTLTEVGPGTPTGELLRRYWHPVAPSADATDLPRQVRLLGEDLILFRSGNGEPGLVTPRCCHRGTTLYFGRVDDDGIRCPYHGWLFAPDGRCLDQPCEPDRGRNLGRYRQPWYPVVEYHGLIFAYLGPVDRQPVFPRYDIFEGLDRETEEIVVVDHFAFGGPGVAPCNWFQTHENVMDPYHVFILHNAMSGPQFSPDLQIWPRVDWERNELGVASVQDRRLPDGTILHRVTETRMPTVRVIATPTLTQTGKTNNLSWAQPIDDTHTRVFTMIRTERGTGIQGGARYGPDGKDWSELDGEEHQRYPGDYETQVGQGPVTLHSEERLSSSDRGVSLVRRQFVEQVRVVADGGDPVGTVFDEADAIQTVSAGNYLVGPDTPVDEVPFADSLEHFKDA